MSYTHPSSSAYAEPQPANLKKSLCVSLRGYVALSTGAAVLLGSIEWVDTQIQLTPVFGSLAERIIFTSYFSLNVLTGATIGLLIGLFAFAVTFLTERAAMMIGAGRRPRSLHRLMAGFLILLLAAVVLKQQPHIHGYLIGLLREAEKIDQIRLFVLNHERSLSYLLMFGYVVGFWLLCRVSIFAASTNIWTRMAILLSLTVLIALAYYVDSRTEVQRYEPSMHRTLFIMNTALVMAVSSAIYHSSERLRSFKLKPAVLALSALVVIVAGGFSFINFDHNHNLKTQALLRTTQMKQHVNLIQWALDLDRDGWSAVLGGGDADDMNPNINPGLNEVIGDRIDNNCMAGDLTERGVEEWQRQFQSAHSLCRLDAKRLNVIHILVDTLRADRLGTYGYQRNTSPNIDKVAAKAQVFDNAFSPTPNTFSALPKFTQGTYWDAHLPGWPEILADNGYEALLFPRRMTTILRHVRGMKVVEEARVKTFSETIDVAIRVLGNLDSSRPFAAYLYSTDPHRPYRKHEQFNFGSRLEDLYDGEVAYFDYHSGRLFDWMESTGRLNDTIIAIFTDHGESLGERGIYKHSTQLYNEQMRSPLIVYLPHLEPRRISEYVSTIDVGPTLLNTVGLEHPKECAGVSLLPLMKGEPFNHPPVYGEQSFDYTTRFVRPDQTVHRDSKKYMVITQDGYKLIFNRNANSFELFNLKEDSQELRNLYHIEKEKAAEMKRLIGRYIDVVTASRPWDADETQYFFGAPRYTEDVK